jgi:hypothetical protein
MKMQIKKIENNIYHSKDGFLSSSVIKAALGGTINYHNYITGEHKTTPDMEFGTAGHTCLLEFDKMPETVDFFDEDMRPEPDKTFASTANKLWKIGMLESMAGKIVLPKDRYDLLLQMRAVAMSYPNVKAMIDNATKEISFYITDWEVEGIGVFNVKIRPDILLKNYLVDYKTTNDITRFKSKITSMQYDLSMALYYDVLKEFPQWKELEQFDCYWLIQDNTGSCNIDIVDATEWLELGRAKYRKALCIIDKYNKGLSHNAIDDHPETFARSMPPSSWDWDGYEEFR